MSTTFEASVPSSTVVRHGPESPPVLMLALRMLQHNRLRLFLTTLGLGVAFFLAAAQFGLLVGWIHTTTAVVNNAGVDVWVMARQTSAFDYGTPIPRARIFQLRSVPGVKWAEGLFMAWNVWQCPDGRRIHVEVVGLDDRCAGGPWKMKEGDLNTVRQFRDAVVIDELYLGALGVSGRGESVEMFGQRARVTGISRGVRTFTAAPFVFTSVEAAIRYDQRYKEDEITYAIAKCKDGYSPEQVRDAARQEVQNVEVLTTKEMAVRTAKYWMLETGVGITVVITAILGILVGAVIMSQTLFAITQDHLPEYGTLMALGFSRKSLLQVVLAQALMLGGAGVVIGSLMFYPACLSTARTPIPLETTPVVFVGLVSVSIAACLGASFLSVRSIFHLDPATVFR